jgi:hypothetical protein
MASCLVVLVIGIELNRRMITTELMPSAHKDRVLLEIGKARRESYGVEEQNPLPMLHYLFVVPYQNKWFL